MEASRPDIPGYGILPADEGDGLLPWSWAQDRLTSNVGFWVSTVRADGRPHAMPVWAVWLDGALWFSTGDGTVKLRNIRRDPRVTVTTSSTTEAVIIEGEGTVVDELPSEVGAAYIAKYATEIPPTEPVVRVEPRLVFAFIDDMEGFARTATRWRFPGVSP